ncbi:MAG TPA: hypothetical protein VK249_19980 [Anaerolineales bacterium]|nr:hypothetical protein [Anaerolineales bacterium]
MKHLSTLTIVVAISMIISACGAQGTPTASPVDVQNTAVAAAFTMIAETQGAIPTTTPLPPTEPPTQTPLPTNTQPPLPTLEASPTAAAASGNAGGDLCDSLTNILKAPSGQPTRIRIDNTTKVTVVVSVYLNKTEFGECGFRSYTLPRNGSVVIDDLVQGCYDLNAWSDDPKGRFRSSGSGCINNTDKWTFEINKATVKFIGP